MCGDGELLEGEACDDGNLVDGDGCSSTCQVEEGWTCSEKNITSFCEAPLVHIACHSRGSLCRYFGVNESSLGISLELTNENYAKLLEESYPLQDEYQVVNFSFSVRPLVGALLSWHHINLSYGMANCSRAFVKFVNSSTYCLSPADDLEFEGGNQPHFLSYLFLPLDKNKYNSVEPSKLQGFHLSITSSQCGDGRRSGVEGCDDGNKDNGDGCSSSCNIENGYSCLGGSFGGSDGCLLTSPGTLLSYGCKDETAHRACQFVSAHTNRVRSFFDIKVNMQPSSETTTVHSTLFFYHSRPSTISVGHSSPPGLRLWASFPWQRVKDQPVATSYALVGEANEGFATARWRRKYSEMMKDWASRKLVEAKVISEYPPSNTPFSTVETAGLFALSPPEVAAIDALTLHYAGNVTSLHLKVYAAVCGDGRRVPPYEQCDNGNTDSDGCLYPSCQVSVPHGGADSVFPYFACSGGFDFASVDECQGLRSRLTCLSGCDQFSIVDILGGSLKAWVPSEDSFISLQTHDENSVLVKPQQQELLNCPWITLTSEFHGSYFVCPPQQPIKPLFMLSGLHSLAAAAPYTLQIWPTVCGDDIREGWSEECDYGAAKSSGCSPLCLVLPGYLCEGGKTTTCLPTSTGVTLGCRGQDCERVRYSNELGAVEVSMEFIGTNSRVEFRINQSSFSLWSRKSSFLSDLLFSAGKLNASWRPFTLVLTGSGSCFAAFGRAQHLFDHTNSTNVWSVCSSPLRGRTQSLRRGV